MRGRLGALEERPFRLLWLGRTSSYAGDVLISVALAFAVLEIGGGASGLGIVLATLTLSRAVFSLAGGVWADRLPRRAVMIACDLVRAAVDVFTAAALFGGFMELWMFVVTTAVFGAATAFFGPASTGLVPATISPGRLQQANALLGLSESGMKVFGPALSGLIVAAASPAWVFAVDAASFVASAGFLLALRVPHVARQVRQRFLADLAEGWREVASRRWLKASFAAGMVGNLGLGPFFVLGPVVAARELGGATSWGLILAGGAAGGIAGGVLALRLRPGRPLVAANAGWLLAVLPTLALAPPLPTLALAGAMGGYAVGVTFGNAVWETVLQREIPRDRLSRVDSYDWLVSLISIPLGQALAGPVADAVGVQATLLGAAALTVAGYGGVLLDSSVRGLRAPAPARVSA